MVYLITVARYFIWSFHFLRFVKPASSHLKAESLQNVAASQFQEDHYYWNSSDTRRYPWLKLCNDKGQYEIQPGSWCSKGVHFPNGYTPGCVCPYGLWVVKNKICKVMTHFLLGDGRHGICFLINFQIESLIFLGDPNNVYASKVYVAPVQLSVFYEIPLDGSFSQALDLDKPVVIHMFPINNRSIETEDGNCFPMIQPNTANIPIHIWSSALNGPMRYRVVDKCKDELNFGFDELISPNIVFVRSNLINVAALVPKPRQCSASQVARCNQFTTTVRPPQYHTPKNHERLYYDLAKVSPAAVNKAKADLSKQPFHSVEVIAPNEGNLSKFNNKEQERNVELPIIINAKMFKELRSKLSKSNYWSHEKGVELKNVRSSEEKSQERGSNNKGDDNSNEDPLSEVMKDILETGSLSEHQKKQRDVSLDKKLSGQPSHEESAEEDSDGGQFRSESTSTTFNRKTNSGASWEDFGETDMSGWCLGQPLPPIHCNLGTSKHESNLLINLRTTEGTNFLQDLLQKFDNDRALDSDLEHITSFTENSGQVFHKFCSIPETIMPSASWQVAMRIVLARVGAKNLKKSFAGRLLKNKELSFNKEGNVMGNCSKDAGKIEFLFQDNCPLKISCTKYSISPETTVKVITVTKPERTVSGKTILTITLETIVRYLEIMCQNSWQDITGSHRLTNVLSKLRHLALNQERESSSSTLASNFIEKDVQSFLKISNVPAYLMLLEKCVLAAETISENRGAPSSTLRYSAPVGKTLHEGKRKIREKRSKPSITTKHEHVPMWVLGGSAICMNSYWDGVNTSNKDHDCIPSPSHR